jgi:hypothetical protein
MFLEAMVLAGQFPRDVKVMPSTGGEWTPLSAELGEPTDPKPQASKTPDTKTILTWIFSLAAIAGVVAFVSAIVLSENIKKEEAQRKARLAATSTPVPTPRYTPPPRPSSTPGSYTSSSSSYLANTPITLPATTPEVRRAVAANTPVPAPNSGLVNNDAAQTFRVSSYDDRRLGQMQAGLKAEEKLLEQQKASLDALSEEISRARRSLNTSSQVSIDRFNAKVSHYNNQSENLRIALDRFNRKADEYNAELERVGTPIR